MSYLAIDALATRVREVLAGGFGSLREITADTYGTNLPAGFSVGGDAVRAIGQPQIEATIGELTRSPSSPPTLGNLALYDVTLHVRCVRRVSADIQLDAAARDAAKAAAAVDTDVIAQALGYPGNLTATSGAAQTGLISGCFRHVVSRVEYLPSTDDGASIIEGVHEFAGVMRSAPEV